MAIFTLLAIETIIAIVTLLAIEIDIHGYRDRPSHRNRHGYHDHTGHRNRHCFFRNRTGYQMQETCSRVDSLAPVTKVEVVKTVTSLLRCLCSSLA